MVNRLRQSNIPFVYSFILYIAGLLLFLEWLYPVEQVTDTKFIGIFIMYTFFCFFISLLQVKWWLSFILKGFGILFVLNGIFSDYPIWNMRWLHELFTDLTYNIQTLIAREWFDLSNMFRTLLFLIIIWLMSYLIHYWFIQVKRVMIFSVLTFIYIALLDTFTVYHANWAIARTFVIAFLALGIANIVREIQRENMTTSSFRFRSLWILPLVMIVLFSTVVGYAAPKLEPQWNDPVEFIKSAKESFGNAGGYTVQKVGYGEDDSRLGGSFVQDYTQVFQAYVKKESYFRIESKDVYTGKGWVNSSSDKYIEQPEWNITFETFASTVETEPYEMSLKFDEGAKIPKLIYPYGATHVNLKNQEVGLWLNEESGEMKTEIDGKDVVVRDYSIRYNYPSYPIDRMRKSQAPTDTTLLERYTNLPNTVPERVYDLAEEITARYDNQYDKVRAVERYFSANGFVYQTSDVAVPSDEQDYVDQFLFETKVGYCDNFSSSMVVLLRTLDIPARWVKGFTSGDKLEDNIDGEGTDLYEITNANAHSWVEVYFEGVGWVPFEPTQGFRVPNDYDVSLNNQHDDALEAPEISQPERPEPPKEAQDAFSPSKSEDGFNFDFTWIHGVIIVVLLLLLAGFLFWKRFELETIYLHRKIIKKQDAASYQDAYLFILKLLKNKGFNKGPDQTLREFATKIDNWYGSDEMGQLTTTYEKLIYQNSNGKVGTEELSNLWKNLIKRILG